MQNSPYALLICDDHCFHIIFIVEIKDNKSSSSSFSSSSVFLSVVFYRATCLGKKVTNYPSVCVTALPLARCMPSNKKLISL